MLEILNFHPEKQEHPHNLLFLLGESELLYNPEFGIQYSVHIQSGVNVVEVKAIYLYLCQFVFH